MVRESYETDIFGISFYQVVRVQREIPIVMNKPLNKF